MNDMGDKKRAWTLNSLIEAMLEAMPNAKVSVINKLAPKPLIFIDSGMYLGDSIEDGTDHQLHDLEPELSLPLIDDGGPTPEDLGLVVEEYEGDDALNQWIKNAVAASVPTDNIDTPNVADKLQVAFAAKAMLEAERMYGAGIITEEELERKREVLKKAKALHDGGFIDDDWYEHAIRSNELLMPVDIPKPEDLSSDPEVN